MSALNIDEYLARRYHLETSNCWHLFRDAWAELTGIDLGDRTPASLAADALTARFRDDLPAFERLAGPQSPCAVLMRSPGAVPHIGLYYRGSVLQMTRRGASYMRLEIATAGWATREFYK